MRLAKPHLDIGLFTNSLDEHLQFWGEFVGLKLDQELFMEEGWIQYRHDANNSVIKVNHYSSPLYGNRASGYSCLTIAKEGICETRESLHPGGELVRIVPKGTGGVTGIGITVSTPDPEKMMEFYCNAMEFDQVGDRVVRCGDSLIFVKDGPGGYKGDTFIDSNFRYLTVQVFDADAVIENILAKGGRFGMDPIDFRDVARYGFVRDPDGNWIEISARRSLIAAHQ